MLSSSAVETLSCLRVGPGVGIGVGDRLAVGNAVDGNADGKSVVVGAGLGTVPSQVHPL